MQLAATFRNVRDRVRIARYHMMRMVVPTARIDEALLAPGDESLYAVAPLPDRPDFAYPGHAPGVAHRLNSCLARAHVLESPAFQHWLGRLHTVGGLHRKLWEYGFICQALYERGMLASARRGLGFAVGQEPLPSYFASLGSEIVASDLAAGDARVANWERSSQWAESLQSLNARQLCPADEFARRVSFRSVDMNHIPVDLAGFDFTWSSCSFEHCGSLELGAQFVMNQMQCLKPGGIAVHTTEFNLSSNDKTVTKGNTVIFRRSDVEDIVRRLRQEGHEVAPLDLALGCHPADLHVDCKPYSPRLHMRLQIRRWAATSIGLIIRKRSQS